MGYKSVGAIVVNRSTKALEHAHLREQRHGSLIGLSVPWPGSGFYEMRRKARRKAAAFSALMSIEDSED